VTKWNNTSSAWECGTDSGGTSYTADGTTLELTGSQFSIKASGVSSTEIANLAVTEDKLAASLAFDDGDLLNLSSINASGTTEGIILPQAADVSAASANGQITWDSDNHSLYVGTGAKAIVIGSITDASGNVVFYDSNGNEVLRIEPRDGTEGPNIIGGHVENEATSGVQGAFIGGGGSSGGGKNVVTDNYGTIAGGKKNQAGELSFVGGGNNNKATGYASMIVGGVNNEASNVYTFAAGRNAKATHLGAFVWADQTSSNFNSAAANEFAVRAIGGIRLVTAVDGTGAPTAGATLAAGSGTWSTLSDRNAKENFSPVDPRKVLDKVAAMPIETWNYKTQEGSIRHIGPMAQDFHAAFGVGENDKTITTVDADGVSLAAIQGLYQLVQQQQALLQQQQTQLQQQQTQLQQQQTAITSLKAENHELHTGLEAVKLQMERLEKTLLLRVAGQ
jgi:hypothetical protein